MNLSSSVVTVPSSMDTLSFSMTERKESIEDGQVCEGGVWGSDLSESVEPRAGAMNCTMMWSGTQDQPSLGIFS